MAKTKRQVSYSERPGNGRVFVKDLEIVEALGDAGKSGLSAGSLMNLGSWAYIYRRLVYLRTLGLIKTAGPVYVLTPSGAKVYAGLRLMLSVIKGVE